MLIDRDLWKSIPSSNGDDFTPDQIFYSQNIQKFKDRPFGHVAVEGKSSCFKNQFYENHQMTRDGEKLSKQLKDMLPVILMPMPQDEIRQFAYRRLMAYGNVQWQTWKLFDHNRKYIIEQLKPPADRLYALKEKFEKVLKEKFETKVIKFSWETTCSIHVRRGDRVKFPWTVIFPLPGLDYFITSIEKTIHWKDPPKTYLICTEDAKFVQENMIPQLELYFEQKHKKTLNFFVADFKKFGQKDFEDMWLMSLCRDNIIINSSFSFWAAYLNQHKDKRVICPKFWYGLCDILDETMSQGLYLPEWIPVTNSLVPFMGPRLKRLVTSWLHYLLKLWKQPLPKSLK